jgi:hypothetical protein
MVNLVPFTSICTAISFGRVSVVIIARQKSWPPFGVGFILGMPALILFIGNGTPMTPVLATRTSSGDMLSLAAVSSAISRASASPCPPIQALAQPEFTTIACARFLAIWLWDKMTGADLIWLVVKTPAALQGTLEQRMAKSSSSLPFIPAATAPARNPEAEVTLPEGISVNTRFKYNKK